MDTVKNILIFAILCFSTALAQNDTLVNGSVFLGPAPAPITPVPAWNQIAMPSIFTSLSAGGNLFSNQADNYTYAEVTTGTSPNWVTYLYRWDTASLAANPSANSWVALGTITSATCTACGTEYGVSLFVDGSGNVLFSMSNNTSTNNATALDVLVWNGSTVSPSWSPVGGYTSSTTGGSDIYQFAQDVAGYSYFIPARSGNIWRSTSVGGTTFSNVAANVYTLSICGSRTAGSLYTINDAVLSGTERLFTFGEGVLLGFPTSFASCGQYLTSGYTGNGNSLASDSSVLLIQQTSTYPNGVSSMNLSTGAVTNSTCVYPYDGTHCVAFQNGISSMGWLYGTKFYWSVQEHTSNTKWNLVSSDNGVTWQNTGTIPNTNCTGSNAEVFQHQSQWAKNVVFAKCQSGKIFWVYGPV